jgi:uncharacterized protein YcbX
MRGQSGTLAGTQPRGRPGDHRGWPCGRYTVASPGCLDAGQADEYWPDIEGLDDQDTVTEFALPPGTFFDCATVDLLTTATLDRLRDAYTHGQSEIQRFRPNIVVDPTGDEQNFAEDAWIGHALVMGDEVRLRITGPCGRCVMTTLAQGALLRDPEILRTAVQSH